MPTLERVMQLKNQGISESQIAQILREEGISPKEINDSLSQSKIKSAINFETSRYSTEIPEPLSPSSEFDPNPAEFTSDYPMQPSMMPSAENPIDNNYTTTPTDEEGYTDFSDQREVQSSYKPKVQNMYPEYPQTSQAPPQYNEYQEYPQTQNIDIETMNEIAEQIVEEKTDKLKKQISTFNSFKEETKSELEIIRDKLGKMEKNFIDLQSAIIGRIGDYGKDIQTIAKEMRTTQNSFSKIIDPLTDNIQELRKITSNMKPEKNNEVVETPESRPVEVESNENQDRNSPGKKQRDGFENYLR